MSHDEYKGRRIGDKRGDKPTLRTKLYRNRPFSLDLYFSEDAIARFWSKVEIGKPNECWPWLGGRTNDGYGIFSVSNTAKPAHRYVKEIELKQLIDRKLDSSHLCTMRECCNPNHLIIESRFDNIRRTIADRRGRRYSSTITVNTARAILAEKPAVVAYGDRVRVARKFGVSSTTVRDIWRRRSWRCLDIPDDMKFCGRSAVRAAAILEAKPTEIKFGDRSKAARDFNVTQSTISRIWNKKPLNSIPYIALDPLPLDLPPLSPRRPHDV